MLCYKNRKKIRLVDKYLYEEKLKTDGEERKLYEYFVFRKGRLIRLKGRKISYLRFSTVLKEGKIDWKR